MVIAVENKNTQRFELELCERERDREREREGEKNVYVWVKCILVWLVLYSTADRRTNRQIFKQTEGSFFNKTRLQQVSEPVEQDPLIWQH